MSPKGNLRRKARPVPTKETRDPPKGGPLAGLGPDQIENLLLRAVLTDLKAGDRDPASSSNGSKCELGERLRRETGLPLRSISSFLRISKGYCEYQRARIAERRDRDSDIRYLVRELFEAKNGARGYRAVHARLRRAGVVASEKRVRRVVREEGCSSYAGELWLTDITEFRLPSRGKAYLSPIVDCLDGKLAA